MMATYEKIDAKSLELTHKQIVFEEDILREKETIEKRLIELNLMLEALKK